MFTIVRNCAALLTLFCVLAATQPPANAAEQVRTRGWSHATYGRIIFDWPKRVTYDARIDGATLTVRFSRPMEAEVDRVLKYLGGFVTGARLSEDGKTAVFDLAGLFDLDTFTSGNSVVIDLRRTQASAQPPRDARMAPLRVRVGRHPGFTRLVFDWLDPVEYSVSRIGRDLKIRFQQQAVIDVTSLDLTLPKPDFGMPRSRLEGRDLVLDMTIPEQSYIRHFRDDAKIVLDVQQEGGDFGGVVATEYTAAGGLPPVGTGPMIQTISPTGEVIAIPAMIGTTVALMPGEGGVPLITEEVSEAERQRAAGSTMAGASAIGAAGSGATRAPIQGSYTPMTHYDPNATGIPRDLLLYDRAFRPGSSNGG